MSDELQYQIYHKDTEACFSPIRLLNERFDVINEAMPAQARCRQQLPDLPRTDFSSMITEPNRRPMYLSRVPYSGIGGNQNGSAAGGAQ